MLLVCLGNGLKRLLKQFKARYHISRKPNPRANFLIFITGPSLKGLLMPRLGCLVLRNIKRNRRRHVRISAWCYAAAKGDTQDRSSSPVSVSPPNLISSKAKAKASIYEEDRRICTSLKAPNGALTENRGQVFSLVAFLPLYHKASLLYAAQSSQTIAFLILFL
jgi:hypothetical protein